MWRYDYMRIRTAREREGLTQTDAAALAGIGLRQYQKYEANESEPGIGAYLRIVNALGLDPADLLRDE